MTTLTIEIPDQVDQQLQISKISHKDLVELFLRWIQVYLSDPDSSILNTTSSLIKSAPKRPLSSILGTGQGSFPTPEEADAFIRAEREAWTS